MTGPDCISLIRPCTEQDLPLPIYGADEVLLATEPGKARACNAAARRSTGTILVFVDADTHLEGDIDWYRHRPDREQFWVSKSRCTEPGVWLWTRLGNAFFNTANKMPLLRRFPWAHGAMIAVRRAAFEAVGGFDEDAPIEDVNLFLRLWLAGFVHSRSPVSSVQIRHISFPPRRMNRVVDGHSGGYLARPMPLAPDTADSASEIPA